MKISDAQLPELARRVAALIAHWGGATNPGQAFINQIRIISTGEQDNWIRFENTDVDEPATTYGYINFQRTDAASNTTGTLNVGITHDNTSGSEDGTGVYFADGLLGLFLWVAGTYKNLVQITADRLFIENAALKLGAVSSTPAHAASTTDADLYVKGGKLIARYDDGGTVRYKYLDLTGTGVTWVHTTSAP